MPQDWTSGASSTFPSMDGSLPGCLIVSAIRLARPRHNRIQLLHEGDSDLPAFEPENASLGGLAPLALSPSLHAILHMQHA